MADEETPIPSSAETADSGDDRTSWTRTLDAAAVPVNALIESAPPEVAETLTQKVAQALQTALDHSRAMLDKEKLEERLSKARAFPGSDAAGYEGHLMAIEEAVANHCAEVKKRTVLGSCVTGFAGAAGQLADVPAFYLYAVHSLQEIAILRPEGGLSTDIWPMARLNVSVIVESNSRRESGNSGGGGRISLEGLIAPEHWQAQVREFIYTVSEVDYRITESDDTRITESGDNRITE